MRRARSNHLIVSGAFYAITIIDLFVRSNNTESCDQVLIKIANLGITQSQLTRHGILGEKDRNSHR